MKWEKILIALVSAVFAVILYLLLPIDSQKYRLCLLSEEAFTGLENMQYMDLDGDGSTELVRWKKRKPVPAIVVQQNNFSVLDQWNLNGEWISETKSFTSDYDQDGFREVVSFTYHQDSLWLHIIEPMQEGGANIHLAIDRIEKYNGNHDWFVSAAPPTDMNGDGYEDYVVSIRAGFTIRPRKLYIVDPVLQTTISLEGEVGNTINFPVLFDLDGDGHMEISGFVSAPGNIVDKEVPVHDSVAWLLVYDHQLKLKSPPISYPGRPAYVRTLPVKNGGRQLLVSAHYLRKKDEIVNHLQVWEWKSGSLQEISGEYLPQLSQVLLLTEAESSVGSFYTLEGESVVRRNEQLQETDRTNLKSLALWSRFHSEDLDGDGMDEHLLYDNNSEIIIARNDFSHPVRLDLGFNSEMPHYSVKQIDGTHSLMIFRGSHLLELDYSKNPLYAFRLLILLLSFVAYYFIFSLMTSLQKRRIERRLASERQVLHFQLTNVMQQLDPHFLFNALSNISSYYHQGDKEHAQNYLAKISKLIRSSLENSEKMSISLEEELAFVKDYLFVEGIRMGDRFDYVIDVEMEIIQDVQVPKILIQNFVENAMKHGVRHLTARKGLIKLSASLQGNILSIVIEDNGVGREKARELGSFGTGNGLVMVQKTLDIFEKLEKIKISFKIEDLFDEAKQPAGTKVLIEIPLK